MGRSSTPRSPGSWHGLSYGLVYDPCLCDPYWCGPPTTLNQHMVNPIVLENSGSLCLVTHVKDLVIDPTTQAPPWPAASTTTVPRPLARSNFKNNIVSGSTNTNFANTNTFWAASEGNQTTNYCDLVVDYWPDEWVEPVGYQVTIPCTGAAYRTFDSAWEAVTVGSTVQMRHAGDSLRNQTYATNNYGAQGSCRWSNYGMAMDTLNPMRVCTQTDESPTDPSVPIATSSSSSLPQWGSEVCSTSPLATPWQQTLGAPSGVGTLPSGVLQLLSFDSWGSDGPAPQKMCTSNQDCATGFYCALSQAGNGVCAASSTCFQHQHCAGSDQLCSGDGKCVNGIIEITNNQGQDISIRTHSSNCPLNALSVDMWGTSKEQTIPDILNASGMCSYRSWFEHRQLQSNGQCSANKCTLQGSIPWNFSSPYVTSLTSSFSSGVLKVLPHSCDRDYEHMQGLTSCAPLSYYMTDGSGNVITTGPTSRTRTYSKLSNGDTQIQIVKQSNVANMGTGFLGVSMTYPQMGYASTSSPASSPHGFVIAASSDEFTLICIAENL